MPWRGGSPALNISAGSGNLTLPECRLEVVHPKGKAEVPLFFIRGTSTGSEHYLRIARTVAPETAHLFSKGGVTGRIRRRVVTTNQREGGIRG